MRFLLRLCVVAAAVAACGAYISLDQRASAQTQSLAGRIIISELRMRGPGAGQTPNPAEDEFVEIYNNTDQPITVQAVDASGGWGVTAQDAVVRCVIPNGTTIPARGHFLCANTDGYSLGGYPSGNPAPVILFNSPSPNGRTATTSRNAPARPGVAGRRESPPPIVAASPVPFSTATPDAAFLDTDSDTGGAQGLDIPDGFGVALFLSASPTNQNAGTRLDAFGFTNSPALYKEGSGFAVVPSVTSQMTFFRSYGTPTGLPKDTDNNAADFLLAATDVPNISISLLGAPGPENLSSPVYHNNDIGAALLDPAQPSSAPPNRERRPNFVTNGNLGTLFIRRTFTNNTGQPVTRLRLRITNLTTIGTENQCSGGVCSDLRALTSADGESSVGTQVVAVRGVRLEEPPEQAQGGGFNSSLSADFITLGTPLAPGESVNIQLMFGVMRAGPFRVLLDIEAQTAATLSVSPVE
ncbi:MAG: lamin tail domain-containing protein [Rubrivivax sp.]|nr:lamin tail domain-containing protein [Pyrinomonadaceae bacterium]